MFPVAYESQYGENNTNQNKQMWDPDLVATCAALFLFCHEIPKDIGEENDLTKGPGITTEWNKVL